MGSLFGDFKTFKNSYKLNNNFLDFWAYNFCDS